MSDSELLQRYLQDGSQDAFAALVARHLNLVYSAARRQVQSAQLAEEVAQSVFIDLSRQAQGLKTGTPLVAWLYVVTRRASLKVLRRESRRQAREQTAYEIAAMNSYPPTWPQVEPLLDEAMESLDDTDRSAVLLRYFENQSLREVGQSLGTSEDAAQKRVSRAVDQLRSFFLQRGVTVSASGLATDLSAHALQTAPAGLGASISIAATLPHTAATIATQLVMTTTQKTLLAAALALVVGGALYESSVFAHQKSDLAVLEQRATSLSAELRLTRGQQLTAANRLASVRREIDARPAQAAGPAADSALEQEMKAWLAKLDQLKQLIKESPGLGLPEFQFVSDETWFGVAADAKLDSDAGIRQALAKLRYNAENTMANKLNQALGSYVKATGGTLPDHVTQLLPFFEPAVDPSLLDRYEMLQTGKLSEVSALQRMSVLAAKSPVDVEYDEYWTIGVRSVGAQSAMRLNLNLARSAFAAAHDGQQTSIASELLPYLKWPVDESVVEKFLNPPPTVPRALK